MPSNTIIIVVVLFVIAAVVVPLIINWKKKKVYYELLTYLENGNTSAFDEKLHSRLARFLFTPFQIEYLKLNEAILTADPKEIDPAFAVFDKRRLSTKQKEDIYMKGFNYYISVEDPKLSKKYLDLVHTLENEQMKKETEIIYDIYIQKGHHYLQQVLEETEELDEMYRGVNEFLISKMYANMDEPKMAKEYFKKAETHMKMLDKKLAKQHKDAK